MTKGRLANVLNLGHTLTLKEVRFHPRALEFIREQSVSIRRQLGEAIRDLQRGIRLQMPLSRPMPSVAPGVHELRVKDATQAVRVFYVTKTADSIWVFHGFQKKTQATPKHELEAARERLFEVSNEKD